VNRREFITLLGAAHARERVPTIGFLDSVSQSAQSTWTAAFVERMREHGWIEGHTVEICENINTLSAETRAFVSSITCRRVVFRKDGSLR
jgi:hypothetical protein